MTATDAETLTELFASVGLTPAKAAETAANKKLAPSLQTVIETAGTVVRLLLVRAEELQKLTSDASAYLYRHHPLWTRPLGLSCTRSRQRQQPKSLRAISYSWQGKLLWGT